MHIFVINLKKDTQKREDFIKNFKPFKLEYEFIDGVYGGGLSEGELKNLVYDYPNCFMTKGEIGCALSHLKIYQKTVDEDIPYALILEDDTLFDTEFPKYLKEIENFLSQKLNFELVCLMYQGDKYLKNLNLETNKRISLYKMRAGTGTYGYVITKAAAKKLLKSNTPIILEADCWIQYLKLCGLNLYCLDKDIVKTSDSDGLNSSIGSDRHKLGKQKSNARKQRMRKFGGIGYILRGLRYRAINKIFKKQLICK